MKAAVVEEPGDYDAILIKNDVPTPSPGPNQVVIQNHYSGVNYIDTYHRDGTYPVPLPVTLGREGSGIVSAVGAGAEAEFAVGDRVAYIGSGSYAEYTAVNALHVIKLPPEISFEQGAASLLQGTLSVTVLKQASPGPWLTLSLAAARHDGHLSGL